MVRYVLLRPLRPELDVIQNNCRAESDLWESVHFNNNKNKKIENAFRPLPARTKASNADMTACLSLQDCIAKTTRPDNSAVALHAPLHESCPAAVVQVLKLHGCARRCPTAVAVSQTAYKCSAVTCSDRIY
jgi:hypothetical protein